MLYNTMSKEFLNKKTISRLAVIQSLYQFELNEQTQTVEELNTSIKSFYTDYQNIDDDQSIKLSVHYFNELLLFSIEKVKEVDEIIYSYLSSDTELNKIGIIVRSILRAGVAELKYFPETPRKVILNEYSDLASELAREQDVGFINSILDKYSKEGM